MIIKVQRQSSACNWITLLPLERIAIVEWRSGRSVSGHFCRRRDMLRLLIPGTSMGQWVNRHCLQRHDAVSV